ncbi:ferredoxin reductase [Frankia sp. QA3]|uniref:ferredoxin reductase n=1 Tax=Frankia sp. QA3 TaxID=710111 RepID=UPI000269CB8C|nr:ferredoxin reductase [Frankia sp. QA3]EIV95445.1 flavodoxin reductase family protein [Frankia sp. QA3]
MLDIRPMLTAATGVLTSPLMPDDYRAMMNPLWSRQRLSGRVEAVVPETPDASTVVIRPGRGWRRHLAGQHVGVGVDIEGVWHWRTFSLSSPPGRPDGLVTITVKAAPGGFVSEHVVRRLRPGGIVRLSRPAGGFVLPDDLPTRLLFVTAGSGITPVMSMLRGFALAGDLPDVFLAHVAPNGPQVIFGGELRRMAARFPGLRLHEHHTRPVPGRRAKRLTMADLSAVCPDLPDRMAWVCGPRGLLDDAEAYWRAAGIADRLRTERFQPVARPSAGPGGRVRFVRSGRETAAGAGTPLLAVGEEADVAMPSGCRMGVCRTCLARLAGGRVRDLRTGEVHGDPGDLIQTCVSTAVGDVDIDL